MLPDLTTIDDERPSAGEHERDGHDPGEDGDPHRTMIAPATLSVKAMAAGIGRRRLREPLSITGSGNASVFVRGRDPLFVFGEVAFFHRGDDRPVVADRAALDSPPPQSDRLQ